MAFRIFCNGCGGGPLASDDVHRVSLSVATLPGMSGDEPGVLATDMVVGGVLCDDCVEGAKRFVLDGEGEDEEAAHLVLGDVVGSPS
jgi:hypothetical protein